MNILLINHYAGSPQHGMEYRPFYFAREWVRAGHRVLIVAADFSHLRQVNPRIAGALAMETIEGIDYLWVKAPAYQGNGTARVRNMAAFIYRLRTACSRPIKLFAPDVVIASSTYTWDNWVAAHYARESGAKYVYEVHDLWPLSPMELGGMKPWHPFIWSLQKAEDFACREADVVVSMLPAAGAHLEAHGMGPDKFVHIPNGIAMEEWDAPAAVPTEHLEAIQEVRSRVCTVVGYVGGHALSNALDCLVDAGAEPLLADVAIVCVGYGAEKVRLQEKARALGSNVVFLPPVPKWAVASLLPLFDILYIGWANSPLYRFGISPNKLFEYMMSAVPIVHAVDAANDPVKESACGLSVEPGNEAVVRDGILELAALSPDARYAMGRRGREYVERHHDISALAQKMLATLEN